MTPGNSKDLLQAEADFLASGLHLQAQAMSLLLAEMQALSSVLPGANFHPERRDRDEATTEADFDNMPV